MPTYSCPSTPMPLPARPLAVPAYICSIPKAQPARRQNSLAQTQNNADAIGGATIQRQPQRRQHDFGHDPNRNLARQRKLGHSVLTEWANSTNCNKGRVDEGQLCCPPCAGCSVHFGGNRLPLQPYRRAAARQRIIPPAMRPSHCHRYSKIHQYRRFTTRLMAYRNKGRLKIFQTALSFKQSI